jgi:hypothetical protein
MTLSFPTFSIAFDIRSPISFSPFAEMVATWIPRGKWKWSMLNIKLKYSKRIAKRANSIGSTRLLSIVYSR